MGVCINNYNFHFLYPAHGSYVPIYLCVAFMTKNPSIYIIIIHDHLESRKKIIRYWVKYYLS